MSVRNPTAPHLAPVRDVDRPAPVRDVDRPAPGPPRLALVPRPAQAALPLDFPLPSGRSADPDLDVRLRLASHRVRWTDEPDRRDLPTPRAELPDPRPWCVRLVQAAVEATSGDRPVAQLLRWTSREVYDQISRDAAPQLVRTARRRRTTRPVVRSVHTREPLDGVVEACATVHDGGRARAVALRLEGLGGRWVCTALDVVR